jgi:hypothetical protein
MDDFAFYVAVHQSRAQSNAGEKAMPTQTKMLRKISISGLAVVALSLPLMASSAAWSADSQCKFDPVTHRCVPFRSDSTWPNGFRHSKDSNGG